MLRLALDSKKTCYVLLSMALSMPLVSRASTPSDQSPVPDSPQRWTDAVSQLAVAVESGDFFEAERVLKTIPQKLRQSDIQLLTLEALVDKGFYRTNAAHLKLKKALRLDRNNGDALYEMAVLLMEKRLWRKSEVLLRAASVSPSLSDARRRALPYYLGVTAFESGRVFESRNHFIRLNWMDSLDFAIRQSSNSYLADIAGRRPWSVVAPILYQYESNVLGLDDNAALPEGYTHRGSGKVVYGLFGNYSGLGGERQGQGPWGFSLRVIASQALEQEFQGLNLIYSEAEMIWSGRTAGKNAISVRPAVNSVRVGEKALSHSVQLKLGLNQSDLTAGFEFDAAQESTTDRSVWISSFARTFEIYQGDAIVFLQPTDFGVRIPVSKEKGGENKIELNLAPGLNWYLSKRISLSLSDQISLSRVSGESVQYNLLRNRAGLKSTWTAQPFLTLGVNYEFEISKRSNTSSLTRKSTATVSALGLF